MYIYHLLIIAACASQTFLTTVSRSSFTRMGKQSVCVAGLICFCLSLGRTHNANSDKVHGCVALWCLKKTQTLPSSLSSVLSTRSCLLAKSAFKSSSVSTLSTCLRKAAKSSGVLILSRESDCKAKVYESL